MASSFSRLAGASSFFPGGSGKRTSMTPRVASDATTAAVQPATGHDYKGFALQKAVEYGVPAVLSTLSILGSAGGVHLISKVHDEKLNKIGEKLDKQAELLTTVDHKSDVGFATVDHKSDVGFATVRGDLNVINTTLAGLDKTLEKMDKKLDALDEEQRQAIRGRR